MFCKAPDVLGSTELPMLLPLFYEIFQKQEDQRPVSSEMKVVMPAD